MSLPYGPVMRGFSASWVYARMEEVIAENLKNIYGVASLEDRTRFICREQLDTQVFASHNLPVALVKITSIDVNNSMKQGVHEYYYSGGTITHTGTGAAATLSGRHLGNARFTLTITASGTVGESGTYRLTCSNWDGSVWKTAVQISAGDIPADGKITVGNGQIFTLPVGGSVVLNDTYVWETTAYKVTNVVSRTVLLRAAAKIYFRQPMEATWEPNNPLDQLLLMFPKRWHELPAWPASEPGVMIEETLTRISAGWEKIPYGDDREEPQSFIPAYCVTAELSYKGPDDGKTPVIFTALVEPLGRTTIDEEAEIE